MNNKACSSVSFIKPILINIIMSPFWSLSYRLYLALGKSLTFGSISLFYKYWTRVKLPPHWLKPPLKLFKSLVLFLSAPQQLFYSIKVCGLRSAHKILCVSLCIDLTKCYYYISKPTVYLRSLVVLRISDTLGKIQTHSITGLPPCTGHQALF